MNEEKKKQLILFGVIPAIVILFGGIAYFIISNNANQPVEETTDNSNYNLLPVDSFDIAEKDSLSKKDMYLRQMKKNQTSNDKVTTGDIFGDVYSVDEDNQDSISEEQPDSKVDENIENIYSYIPEEKPVKVKKNTSSGKKSNYSSGASYKKKQDDEYTKRLNEEFGVEEPQIEQEVVPEQKQRRSRLGNGTTSDQNNNNSKLIHCVVDNGGKSSIKNGDAIRLRITEPMQIGNITVPRNYIITGIAKFNQERVDIIVSNIMYKGKVYNVSYKVYDTDGLAGVYVPGGLNDELAKEGAEQGVSQASTTISIPVVGSISTSMAKKKIEEQVVKIYDNHKLVLKPFKQ